MKIPTSKKQNPREEPSRQTDDGLPVPCSRSAARMNLADLRPDGTIRRPGTWRGPWRVPWPGYCAPPVASSCAGSHEDQVLDSQDIMISMTCDSECKIHDCLSASRSLRVVASYDDRPDSCQRIDFGKSLLHEPARSPADSQFLMVTPQPEGLLPLVQGDVGVLQWSPCLHAEIRSAASAPPRHGTVSHVPYVAGAAFRTTDSIGPEKRFEKIHESRP